MPVVHQNRVRILIHVYAEFSKTAFVYQKSSKTKKKDKYMVNMLIRQ